MVQGVWMADLPSYADRGFNGGRSKFRRWPDVYCVVLDDDGLAAPGEIIKLNNVYIKKESPLETRGTQLSYAALQNVKYCPTSQTFKVPEGESCVVDRVALSSDRNNNLCIKFVIRHTRRPEVGEKFSSRHGQKGVCGTIIQQEDFPFSERGICPDLIMNPRGFPSRMTVGKMIELLVGKAGVSCGRFHYGSAFGEPSGHADRVEVISETLVKHGFNYSGKDFIYSANAGLRELSARKRGGGISVASM